MIGKRGYRHVPVWDGGIYCEDLFDARVRGRKDEFSKMSTSEYYDYMWTHEKELCKKHRESKE